MPCEFYLATYQINFFDDTFDNDFLFPMKYEYLLLKFYFDI